MTAVPPGATGDSFVPGAGRGAPRTEGIGARLAAGIQRVAEPLLGLVYPDACRTCGDRRAGRRDGYVCEHCRSRPGHVRRVTFPYCDRCGLPYMADISGSFVCSNCDGRALAFSRARAAVVATPFILDVLHRYKYGGERWFAPFFETLLVEAAAEDVSRQSWAGVVPIPLHPAREREREFNQARDLACALAKATGLELADGVVQRGRETQTQALLARGERVHNVAHAFALRRGARVEGGRWLVVDDVLTTGATTSAVAAVLRAGGAEEVCVWTLARAV